MRKLSIHEAIKQALSDDGQISKYEARVLRELVMADNKLSATERDALEAAITENVVDDEGMELLTSFLLRYIADR
ncbi:MAG: hypothetical protein K2W95_17515 [Candidatus Obscuribacterales bacterium]|nr:hypothetical protein [Candidatus Obscuribacterales bacterium]